MDESPRTELEPGAALGVGTPELLTAFEELVEMDLPPMQAHRLASLADELLCVVGFDGLFRHANPAWERSLGFRPIDLRRIPVRAIVHPDDQRAVVAIFASALEDGPSLRAFDCRMRAKDGSYRWFRWNAVPDQETGAFYAVGSDVQELREAADRVIELNELLRVSITMLQASIGHAYSQTQALQTIVRDMRGALERSIRAAA
jgi:PAS domain S-box-containing protein